MEASSSGCSSYDAEAKALEGLLEIFGSKFSLKVIASAFCKAGGNPDLAADIILDPRGCSSSTLSDQSHCEQRGASDCDVWGASYGNGEQRGASYGNGGQRSASDAEVWGASYGNDKQWGASYGNGEQWGASDINLEHWGSSSSEMLSENADKDLVCLEKNSKVSKENRYPVSVGTISKFLGKEYSRPTTSLMKPMIINLKELPTDHLEGKDDQTMFMTFSMGYRLTKAELRNFFQNNYGDCIEEIYMGEGPQPLYAKVVFYSPSIITMILDGKDLVKFVINGKDVWIRKCVPKG